MKQDNNEKENENIEDNFNEEKENQILPNQLIRDSKDVGR